MPTIAIAVGALLCIVGALFYGNAEPAHRSVTALIPLFLGFPIAVLGFVARKEKMRKHAMHGAVLLALFGLLGSLMGYKKWLAALSGSAPLPPSGQAQLILFVICLVFIVLSVRSFIAARKAQPA